MTIDILMPYYGNAELFELAVRSVLTQTSDDWRLVVIDDDYADRAPGRWLASLGESRIEYVRNPTNLGISANFQSSLAAVTADHFVLMGCDDLMVPTYIERMSKYASGHPEVAYIQPGVQVIDDSGEISLPIADRVKRFYRPSSDEARVLSGEDLAVSLLRGNWTYFPSICWRRDVVQALGFRQDLQVALDLALQLEIVEEGGTLLLVPDLIFRYRRHDASHSSRTANDGTRFIEEDRLFAEQRQAMKARGWHRAGRVASLHLSSRLNGITRIPAALVARDGRGVRVLFKHIFFLNGATSKALG